MCGLWLKYLKSLLVMLGLSIFLALVFFGVIDIVNGAYGGQAPYLVRFVLLLILIVIFVLLSKVTIDKPYRDLQEAKKRKSDDERKE